MSKDVNALSAQMFMSCLSISMMLQARPQMMLKLLNGSSSRTSKRLATLTAIAAFFEFAFNPTFGAASDRKGRKLFLAISPMLNWMLRSAVA